MCWRLIMLSTVVADHVLLRLADFADDPPIFITVRTRTREGAVSSDSNVSRVPRAISLNLPSGTIQRPTPLTNLNLTTQMSAPSSLVQPLGSLAMPGAATQPTAGLLQTTSTTMGGLTDSAAALSLTQSAYTSALPIGSAQSATVMPGMQVSSIQAAFAKQLLDKLQFEAEQYIMVPGGGSLSRMPVGQVGQLPGGEGLVAVPMGSVGTAQGSALLASASPLSGAYAAAPPSIPVTNALSSYTAAGVGPSLTASGKPNFGYAQSSGMLLDGVLKNYQAPLHEVGRF
ncbi:unnamed protein product [Toxocara canis]|uniref:Ribonucleoprotein PTB-binding 1 n=1 Tax=Toxocara canis TaxID=6265 RepID=A0A183URU1_TOXCA|nr:unnamed protein product [Toxocara canis]